MSQRPKICFLFSRPEPHRIPLLNLIAENVDADFEILYCTQQTYQKHSFGESYQHVMPYRFLSGIEWQTDRKNQSSSLLNWSVISECRRANPDLLLIAGYSNPTMILALFYAWVSKMRYGILNESHLLKKRAWWKTKLKQLLLPIFFKRAFVTFATGTKAKEYLEFFGAKRERIFIFPNACDFNFFSKESSRWSTSKQKLRAKYGIKAGLVLIYVGRLIACKGIETLLSALSQLKNKNINAHLLMVGDGPLKEMLEKQALEQNLTDAVTFAGFVENRDLPMYYSMSDLLVLPSLEETWGVVVNEAMACGLPLILSDQVGAGYDLLEEGKNGFCFTSGNVESLEKAIEKSIRNQEKLEEMSRVSNRMANRYTYQLGVDAFKELLTLMRPLS